MIHLRIDEWYSPLTACLHGASACVKGQISSSQMVVAWLLSKPGVSAPIVGVTRLEQLNDVLGALSVQLTPEEIGQLEGPHEPHRIPTLS